MRSNKKKQNNNIMKRGFLFAFILSFSIISLQAQNLLPHIGLNSQPSLSDSICVPPVFDGSFYTVGLFEGDLVPDFTLYTTEGEERELSQILSTGKHVMIINGSYTCWRFRDEIETMNDIAEHFSDEMETFIIYTVEAHPHIDLSPYSGTLSTGERNFTDSVLLRQPTTYQERLDNINFMLDRHNVVPEILLDGPCNEWWLNYGTAANHAYLINPDGIVQIRHTWFNQPPVNIQCQLTEYFELPSPGCAEIGTFGSFEIEVNAENGTYLAGAPGQTLMVPVTILNLSETDFVFLDILRDSVDVPESWLTSLCVDICLSPGVDQTTTAIPPGESQSFTMYFFTNHNPGLGSVVVKFTNETNVNNVEWITFSVLTENDNTVTHTSQINHSKVSVYPNPATDWMRVEHLNDQVTPYQIYDVSGRTINDGKLSGHSDLMYVEHLPQGVYFLLLGDVGIEPVRFVKR